MGNFSDVNIRKTYYMSGNGTRIHSNTVAGEPDTWFADSIINKVGLSSIFFDFFIDWSKEELIKNIWMKRVVETKNTSWRDMDNDDILEKLKNCDGQTYIEQAAKFCDNVGLDISYMIFKDPYDWSKYPSTTIKININKNGKIRSTQKYKLPELEKLIIKNSGGPVKMNKSLNIANTRLELYLAEKAVKEKGAIWAGDVDLILFDSQTYEPKVLIEFKKHNLDGEIKDQKLSNYYPKRDARKYNRLSRLREFLQKKGSTVPYVVVYYSTKDEEKQIKIEYITGEHTNLIVEKSFLFPLPVEAKDKIELVKKIIES